MDLPQKRAIFFQKFHELKQAFGFYDPKIICEIIKIFGTNFYRSPKTGQHISYLLNEYEQNDINALIQNKHYIKKKSVNALEEGEDWKIDIIEELSLVKKGLR